MNAVPTANSMVRIVEPKTVKIDRLGDKIQIHLEGIPILAAIAVQQVYGRHMDIRMTRFTAEGEPLCVVMPDYLMSVADDAPEKTVYFTSLAVTAQALKILWAASVADQEQVIADQERRWVSGATCEALLPGSLATQVELQGKPQALIAQTKHLLDSYSFFTGGWPYQVAKLIDEALEPYKTPLQPVE